MGPFLVIMVALWPVVFMAGIGLCWRARQNRVRQYQLNDALQALHIVSRTRGRR